VTLRRGVIAASVVLLALLAGLVAYLRRDVTAEFFRVRGEYGGARVLADIAQGDARCREVELRNDRGEVVASAYVRVPLRPATPYRVVVTYVGARTGDAILTLIPPRADQVLIAVQYPYRPPRPLLARLGAPPAIRRAVFRTVAGGMLALTYVERAGLAPARVTVLGASVGTPFAVIHAALDPRVTSLVIAHGGGDLPRVVWTLERRERHPWRAPITAGATALFAASFDPLRFIGRVAPRPLVMLASRNDHYFPVASVQELYDRAGEPKRLVWTTTEHVGTRKTALVANVLARLDGELAAADPLPRAPAPP